MTYLLPCPFCGGEAELTGYNAPEYWVWCPNCKASADAHTGKENAIEAWNTRSAGTCELICHEVELPDELRDAGVEMSVYECSECGERMFSNYNYCPNCGRKVTA